MEEMTGLTLMPKVWVRVTPDPATASVAFKGLRASLGTPGLDAIFTLSFDAALSGRDPPPSVGPSSPHDCELHVTATVDAGIKVSYDGGPRIDHCTLANIEARSLVCSLVCLHLLFIAYSNVHFFLASLRCAYIFWR